MNQLKLAYQIAKTQVGVKEKNGPEHHPQIINYHQTCLLKATTDETPWCSSFVNWCVLMAAFLLNAGMTKSLLIKNRFSEQEIESFTAQAYGVAQMLGYPVSDIESYKLTEEIVQIGTQNALARSWMTFGKESDQPDFGDLVIITRGSDGISGHVGFYDGIGLTFIDILGGNQSDSVCTQTFSRARVLGIRKA